MTNQEFYSKAEEIISSDAPNNDPICGKDRQLGDLLIQAYTENLNIYIFGSYERTENKGTLDIGAINLKTEDKNGSGALCFTSPETAQLFKVSTEISEAPVHDFLDLIYMVYDLQILIFNYGIEDKEVRIERSQLTKWLTPYVRRQLRDAQSLAKSSGSIPRNANMPFLR